MEGDGHTLSSDGSRIPARATEADVADGTRVCMPESSLVMDPLTLKKLYEFQLDGDLQPPVAPHVDRRETFYMLRVSRGLAPGALREDEHARIWAWSDLHLGHTETLRAFGRPFASADEMDDKIFWNWRRVIAPGDTVLILGDVTVHGLWGRRLKRVRQAPGRKILVNGNHEITGAGLVDSDGFDEVHSTLYVDGDPPLLLTHVPLRVVPEGCVNVPGHLHQVRVQGRTRHINVCVEQVHYRPRPLTAIRRLAGSLVRGERVPGRTTAQQLTHAGGEAPTS